MYIELDLDILKRLLGNAYTDEGYRALWKVLRDYEDSDCDVFTVIDENFILDRYKETSQGVIDEIA